MAYRTAEEYLPQKRSLRSLRLAAADCRGCDLFEYATQTVFGEGAAHAPLMLVGEQPGDEEDRTGRPFVGPSGRLLRKAMRDAGILPKQAYITNSVKHFKFIERGKRRIHAKPKVTEIRACEPWLDAEIQVVRPKLIVALGATAAQVLLGTAFRLTQHRGEILHSAWAPVVATVHPSSILRSPDSDTRARELADFIKDLRFAASSIAR
jgi:uracil-DNA glycosylase